MSLHDLKELSGNIIPDNNDKKVYFRDLVSFQPRYYTVGKSSLLDFTLNRECQKPGTRACLVPLMLPSMPSQYSLLESHRKLGKHAEIVNTFYRS